MKTHLLPMTWDPGIRPDRSGLPSGLTNFMTSLGGGIYWAAIAILGVLFIISVIGWWQVNPVRLVKECSERRWQESLSPSSGYSSLPQAPA